MFVARFAITSRWLLDGFVHAAAISFDCLFRRRFARLFSPPLFAFFYRFVATFSRHDFDAAAAAYVYAPYADVA